jgi:hypothetical protein
MIQPKSSSLLMFIVTDGCLGGQVGVAEELCKYLPYPAEAAVNFCLPGYGLQVG